MHADCLLFLFFAVLSSITAVWKRMYASSHSHSSAIHYSTLAMGRHFLPHPQWTEHHITTVDYNSYRLAHFSCAVSWAFMSQTLLWTLFKRLVMQQRTLVYMALNCLCISLQSCVESSVKGAYKQKCQISVCVTLDFKFQCQHWYDFALSQHTENCKLLDVAQKNPKTCCLVHSDYRAFINISWLILL